VVLHDASAHSAETGLSFMCFMKRKKHRKAKHISIIINKTTTELFIFILPVFMTPAIKRDAIMLLQIWNTRPYNKEFV
jgi:hypothetical protein